MKHVLNILLAAVCASIITNTTIPNDERISARPYTFSDVPVYIYSTPKVDYEIIAEIGGGSISDIAADAGRILNGDIPAYCGVWMPEVIDNILRRADRMVRKGKIPPYDAIRCIDGKTGQLIKFK